MDRFLGILKFVVSVLLPFAFVVRRTVLLRWYPDMAVDGQQWNCANNITMNFFSGIIMGCVIISMIKTRYPYGNYFLHIFLWLSFFDFGVHRMALGVTAWIVTDKAVLVIAPICGAITFIIHELFNRKNNKG